MHARHHHRTLAVSAQVDLQQLTVKAIIVVQFVVANQVYLLVGMQIRCPRVAQGTCSHQRSIGRLVTSTRKQRLQARQCIKPGHATASLTTKEVCFVWLHCVQQHACERRCSRRCLHGKIWTKSRRSTRSRCVGTVHPFAATHLHRHSSTAAALPACHPSWCSSAPRGRLLRKSLALPRRCTPRP